MVKNIGTGQYSTHDIEIAINEAAVFLPKNFAPRHEHSKRCYRVLKHILYKNEYTVIEAKQSLFKSIAPTRIVATNQRIIVVNPSFWSIWLGHNVLSPTRYESIPYSSVANITLLTGLSFSSLSVYLTTGSQNWNGNVEGLKTRDAKAMVIFLEKVTESLRKQGNDLVPARAKNAKRVGEDVSLNISKELIRYRGSKFVWLGAHPLEYAAEILNADKDSVIRISMEDITNMNSLKAKELEGCILVCYNGNFASYVSDYIQKTHGVSTYVLHGGIERYGSEQ